MNKMECIIAPEPQLPVDTDDEDSIIGAILKALHDNTWIVY